MTIATCLASKVGANIQILYKARFGGAKFDRGWGQLMYHEHPFVALISSCIKLPHNSMVKIVLVCRSRHKLVDLCLTDCGVRAWCYSPALSCHQPILRNVQSNFAASKSDPQCGFLRGEVAIVLFHNLQ